MADGILASVPVYNSFLLSSSPHPSRSVGSFSAAAVTFSCCSSLAKGSVYRARPIMASSHCKSSSSGFDSSPSSNSSPSQQPSLLVFSGGTAFNGVAEELKKVTTRVAHVLPVSDDGGSTAEIVRVVGGPAVGDIRSRCLRLSDESTSEAIAVRRLLGHRLPLDAIEAKSEWYEIVKGKHFLWNGVSRPYGETIRSFLAYFQSQILQRASDSFCFSNGSIGNFFFAGARMFFQSLDATIFLFSRVSQIPSESLVLPVISTNDRLTLGCELWDGKVICGQNEISHPASCGMQTVNKNCTSSSALPSRIKRVFYMSNEGCNLLHEIFPEPNSAVIGQLRNVDCIVYSMGSLFTSICPSLGSLIESPTFRKELLEARWAEMGPRSVEVIQEWLRVELVLPGIGETIASRSIPKVLLLNGSHDRETTGLSASGFVSAITDALNRTHGDPQKSLQNFSRDYINALLVPKDGKVPVDVDALVSQGILHVDSVDSIDDLDIGIIFEPRSLIEALMSLICNFGDSKRHASGTCFDQQSHRFTGQNA